MRLSREEYLEMEGFIRVLCTKDYVFIIEAVNLKTGDIFEKYYRIPKGAKGTVFDEKNRLMIRLDSPIVALNEMESPYRSKLHRVFDYTRTLENWRQIC